ncbi:hypothetical protein QW131_05240 [Roseibium salinum]|nr:hypothetical protein [Roseibium salinum]
MSPSTDLCFDPLSEAFAQDPYSFYAALRARDGLTYYQDFDVWLASRFDDVSEIVMHEHMVRSLDHVASPDEIAEQKRALNWHDMPHHSRFVQFFVARQRRRGPRPAAQAGVQAVHPGDGQPASARHPGLCGRAFSTSLPTGEEIDFVEDLAAHVPGHIIGRVLGVPDEDCPQLRIWSENIVQFFDIDRSDERKELAERNTTEFLPLSPQAQGRAGSGPEG